jgi:S-DNA-T family DNA segregation ATPase FtsK/SpoIIIE
VQYGHRWTFASAYVCGNAETSISSSARECAAGWNAHALDAPGKFLISSPEHTTPKRARAYHISDQEVATMASANSTVSKQSGAFVPRPRITTEDGPDVMLWVALRNAPENGVTVAELMQQTGMKRSWVYDRLRQHADVGRAVQVTRGRWRADPPGGDAQ